MNDIKVIGVTGPSGAGKTLTADFFKTYGFKIIGADAATKEVLEFEDCKAQLLEAFGNIILENNKISRKKLANIAFSSQKNLDKLNEITHPLILGKIEEQLLNNKLHRKNVILDAPLLFETKLNEVCDVTSRCNS